MTAQSDRMLIAADKALRTSFPSHAYGYGYLQGAIKTALIRLEYGDPEGAQSGLEAALGMSEQPFAVAA